jgi:hypothetical protein
MKFTLQKGWFRIVIVVNRRSFNKLQDHLFFSFFGFILPLFSVLYLFFSETSVDVSITAQNALPYPSSNPLDDQLIYTIGSLESFSTLQDAFLTPQTFMALYVYSEMYSWNEIRHEHTRKEADGSTAVHYTFEYFCNWCPSPPISFFFFDESGHKNEQHRMDRLKKLNTSIFATQAMINNLTVTNLNRLGLPQPDLIVNNSNIIQNVHVTPSDHYLYIDGANPWFPKAGDIRIWYKFTPSALTGLVIGKLEGNQVTEYPATRNNIFGTTIEWFQRYVNASNLKDAVAILHEEYIENRWNVRVECLLMYFGGLFILGEGNWIAMALWSFLVVLIVIKIAASLNSWASFAGIIGVVGGWMIWMLMENRDISGKDNKEESK